MTTPGGPAGAWTAMRSFQQDTSVTRQRLRPGTIRRIAAFARPYRRLLAWFLLVVVLDAALGTALPLLFKAIIDHGIVPGRVGIVEALASVIALIALVEAGLSLLQRWLSVRVGEGLIFDMRAQVFGHVQRQPLAFFSRTQTGALVSRLNNDVLGAQSAFTNTLSAVVSNVLTVGFTLAAMFTLSWQITLIALVLLPVFVLPARALAPRLAALAREGYGLNAEMNSTMTERFNVSGALLAKLYGDPEREVAVFRRQAGRVRDIGVTQAMYGRVFFASLTLVASLATAAVYGVGGRYAAQGHIAVGTIVALTAYLGRLYLPLTQLSNVHVDVMTALVSFERVFEVLDLEPAVADRPGAVPLAAQPGGTGIEFDHVSFGYPAASEVSLASLESVAVLDPRPPAAVLHDVTFRVRPGELVALVGPSGAGKTTISQLVPRIYDTVGGSVRVGGADVRDVTLGSLRDAVGVVTQDAHMFHDTIRANLAYARADATDERMWAALDAAQIGPLVRSLPDGLDTVVGDRGYRLSGGEKQRLAIARLLVKAPSVVVLDEATAHLDSESEAAVQRALGAALAGRTALVIAHRLSTVRDADRILVISGGRVAEEGRHADLLARDGVYAELYRTQFAAGSSESGGAESGGGELGAAKLRGAEPGAGEPGAGEPGAGEPDTDGEPSPGRVAVGSA